MSALPGLLTKEEQEELKQKPLMTQKEFDKFKRLYEVERRLAPRLADASSSPRSGPKPPTTPPPARLLPNKNNKDLQDWL